MPTRDEVLSLDAVILRELETRTAKEISKSLNLPLGRIYGARYRKPDAPKLRGRPKSPSDRNLEIARRYEAGESTDTINQALNLTLTRQRIHQIAKRVKEKAQRSESTSPPQD